MQSYTVKVLSESEWDDVVKGNPRYAQVDDSNLGFADPPNRVAYAHRDRLKQLESFPGIGKEVKNYVIQHEFEHLLSDEHLHEDEHGVRHKKVFKELIAPALPALLSVAAPGIGTALGSGLSGLSLGALGGAAGGAINAAANDQSLGRGIGAGAAQGAISGLGAGASLGDKSIATGLGQAVGTGIQGGSLEDAAKSGALAGGGAFLAGNLPKVGSSSIFNQGVTQTSGQNSVAPLNAFQTVGGGSSAGEGLSKIASGIDSGIKNAANKLNPMNFFDNGGVGGSPSYFPHHKLSLADAEGAINNLNGFTTNNFGVQDALNQGASQAKSFFPGGMPSAAAAAGLLGLSSMKKAPEVPDFSAIPSISSLRENAGQARSPLGSLAQTRLSEQLTQPIDDASQLPPEVLQSMERQFAEEERQLANQFKMFQPEADLASNSRYRQSQFDLQQRQAETLANLQLNRRQQVEAGRRQDISSALGVDEQTVQQLTDLAQLDVQQIALQLGIDAADAQQFKETFGSLAGMFASQAMGMNSFGVPGLTVNLGGR